MDVNKYYLQDPVEVLITSLGKKPETVEELGKALLSYFVNVFGEDICDSYISIDAYINTYVKINFVMIHNPNITQSLKKETSNFYNLFWALPWTIQEPIENNKFQTVMAIVWNKESLFTKHFSSVIKNLDVYRTVARLKNSVYGEQFIFKLAIN